ncbi:SNF2-related protein [Endothiovibrio diazotrophicus]
MLFTLDDLKQHFGEAALEWAFTLLEHGLVRAPDTRRNGALITAVVDQPSGGRPLRTYTRIERNGETLAIHGECGCGRKGGCVHVAAALLRALREEQELDNDALGEAMEEPDDAPSAAPPDDYPADVRQRLLYLLAPAADGRLAVETLSANLRPDGGFERLREYHPAWAAQGTPPRFLLAADLTLLATLDTLPADGAEHRRHLHGPGAPALLGGILATGRARLAADAPPLTPGAPRRAIPRWAMAPNGDQRLTFEADPPAATVLRLPAPWYLDGERCAPLESGLPAELFERPETVDPIPPERLTEATRRLAPYAPTLPPPRLLDEERLPATAPQPRLRLEGAAGHERARLAFLYHGHPLGEGEEPRRAAEGKLLRFDRDPAFEDECRNRLGETGLHPTADGWRLHGGRDAWLALQLDHLEPLRDEGWIVECATGFAHPLHHAEQWFGELAGDDAQDRGDWFEVGLGIELEGARIDLLGPLSELLRAQPEALAPEQLLGLDPRRHIPLTLPDGRTVALPMARLRPILTTLVELYGGRPDAAGKLRLNRSQAARLAELEDDEGFVWHGAERLRGMLTALREERESPPPGQPAGLQATLRDYQLHGLQWLQRLREYRLGGILADDMGLGKTLQTLAHLLLEKEQGRADRPSLLVLPTSLLPNWRREAALHAPALKLLTLHGNDRHRHFESLTDHDLILTTYPLLARDEAVLREQPWHLLILDEAQAIKNPDTRAGKLVRELNARHRLCLTGTPLENHLGELWSLFDFATPGLLGDRRRFRKLFRTPIEEWGDAPTAERLAYRVLPFMLRRTKEAVATELPPKTEILRGVTLEGSQRELYESIRLAMHRRIREEVAERGWGGSRIVLLDALLKLRQVCCDPRLTGLSGTREAPSAKLELLMELLAELLDEGRRILLFSQFTTMLELIRARIEAAGIDYVQLTGRTRDRATPVERFQAGEVPLFLISLKAGGSGLNLTAADTVIHYDPWWNPAVERQASDRAHRIGQEKPVFVYKLICEGSVEERIHEMQAKKQALADGLFEHTDGADTLWDSDALERLFAPLE